MFSLELRVLIYAEEWKKYARELSQRRGDKSRFMMMTLLSCAKKKAGFSHFFVFAVREFATLASRVQFCTPKTFKNQRKSSFLVSSESLAASLDTEIEILSQFCYRFRIIFAWRELLIGRFCVAVQYFTWECEMRKEQKKQTSLIHFRFCSTAGCTAGEFLKVARVKFVGNENENTSNLRLFNSPSVQRRWFVLRTEN